MHWRILKSCQKVGKANQPLNGIFFFFKGSLRLIDVRKTKMLKTISDRLQGSEGIKPVSQFRFRYDKSILHLKWAWVCLIVCRIGLASRDFLYCIDLSDWLNRVPYLQKNKAEEGLILEDSRPFLQNNQLGYHPAHVSKRLWRLPHRDSVLLPSP